MKTKIFKIRLNKIYLKKDEKKVNDFKKSKNIKKCFRRIDLDKNCIIEHYVYEKKGTDYTMKLTKEESLLYDKIIDWRTTKFKEINIKAYEILNNREIRSLVRNKPCYDWELRNEKGFSEDKIEMYGDEILSIINSLYN